MNRSGVVKKPKVSVIIPTFNRANYITQAIDSVLNQTLKDFEIILIDDGSTDNTKEVLRPYMDKIKYIYKENGGPASARNLGIKKSLGDYIALLDSDDLLMPRKLEVQVAIMDSNPSIGLVYSDGLVCRANPTSDLELNPVDKRIDDSYEFAKYLFFNPNVYISAVLVRHECFNDVGLFDESEDIKWHEDTDIMLRIVQNWEVRYSDYPSTIIRHHPIRRSLNRVKVYQSIIKVCEKFLTLYPEFKKRLGSDATSRIANLRYLLAHEYMNNKMFREAKSELIRYNHCINRLNYKSYVYIFILSLDKRLTEAALRLICFFRRFRYFQV